VHAGINTIGKSPDQVDPGELDNHGKPALVVDRQGYIHLVFGSHGGDPKYGPNPFGSFFMGTKGKMTHIVSEKPGDISAWRTVDNLPAFGTYNQWVKTANGDLYLFYRHGSHRSDWVYQKSVDDGRTFSPEVPILKNKVSAKDPTVEDSWYAWFDNGLGDTITASYVYHPCANPKHTAQRNGTYYMQMECRDGAWTNVQGEKLTMPATKESADKFTLIQATGTEKSNHGTCHVDREGHPHIFFRFPGQVRYYRWDGQAWQKPVAIAADYSKGGDGDFIVDSPTSIRALLTQNHAGAGEVNWWTSNDGGLTWSKGATLFAAPGVSFEATALVRNAQPEARMLIGAKPAEEKHLYRQMYVVGDKGPLGRPIAEASNLGDRLETIKLMPPGRSKAEAKARKKLGLDDDDPE
jgi:hypothetical protein